MTNSSSFASWLQNRTPSRRLSASSPTRSLLRVRSTGHGTSWNLRLARSRRLAHRAIIEHLEAVTRGQIRNLIINVPPRHMKSLLVSVFWPAWGMGRDPHRRYLYSSYAASLSIRDSV